ncbi:MBL fold metallo-hydrolase [Bacteroidota bacterium]
MVTSIAIIDPLTKERWLFDITPDFKKQFHILDELTTPPKKSILPGIFLTHGHTGHYTGLINLGREVMNLRNVDVFAMPMMLKFLKENAPWNQLIKQDNIKLNHLKNKTSTALNGRISITPFLVPHRDELTETVGFKITGPNKTAVFIPDVDNWNKNIFKIVRAVDVALIDGTFFNENELSDRDLNEVRHPFIDESMNLFNQHPQKDKIHFIHFNHTNPILKPDSEEHTKVIQTGFQIAREKQIIEL